MPIAPPACPKCQQPLEYVLKTKPVDLMWEPEKGEYVALVDETRYMAQCCGHHLTEAEVKRFGLGQWIPWKEKGVET